MPEERRQQANVPPHHSEAECSVLGSMLLERSAVDKALSVLKPEDFYIPTHQQIFASMQALANRGTPVDIITVSAHMEREGKLYEGGFDYLSKLAQDLLTTANIDQHIELIREKAALRCLIDICLRTAQDCYAGKKGSEELIARAADEIHRIAMGSARGQVVHIKEAVADAYKQISDAFNAQGGLLGLSTGFPLMDRMLSGLQGTQLIVIAGRPGMGKTSFAMNIVEHASAKENATCLVFSMEMSAAQLGGRLLCSDSKVDMQLTRTGRMEKQHFDQMTESIRRISAWPIYVDDSANITVSEMTAKARRLQRTSGLHMIVIDYLQLMNSAERKVENRNQEISQITRSLKIMAKELNVPVLLLSQLSRASERSDAGKYPKLSELRESGAIEQDADVVIFLQREDYYPENRTEENEGKATILIAKQRNGPTGPISVHWDGSLTKYTEVDMAHEGEEPPAYVSYGSEEPPF